MTPKAGEKGLKSSEFWPNSGDFAGFKSDVFVDSTGAELGS